MNARALGKKSLQKLHPAKFIKVSLGPDYIIRLYDAYWTTNGRWSPLHTKSRRPHGFEMRVQIQCLKGLPSGTIKVRGKARPIRAAAAEIYSPGVGLGCRGPLGSPNFEADIAERRRLAKMMPRISASQVNVILKQAAVKFTITKPVSSKYKPVSMGSGNAQQLVYKKTVYSNLRSVLKNYPDRNNQFLISFTLDTGDESQVSKKNQKRKG
jgi:hypothetical protein